jgi:uncharacterized protein YegP (UPF0339 family)
MNEAVREDRTDWLRVRALTDEQIDAAIAADPDSFAMGDKQEGDQTKFVYLVYSDSVGKWRWRLEGSDGRVMAYGAETYATQKDAARAVAILRTAFRKAQAA